MRFKYFQITALAAGLSEDFAKNVQNNLKT